MASKSFARLGARPKKNQQEDGSHYIFQQIQAHIAAEREVMTIVTGGIDDMNKPLINYLEKIKAWCEQRVQEQKQMKLLNKKK